MFFLLIVLWYFVLLQPASEELGAFYEHFVLCNDTQEDLHVGQTDTEESVLLNSRQAVLYSWTSGLALQVRHTACSIFHMFGKNHCKTTQVKKSLTCRIYKEEPTHSTYYLKLQFLPHSP